MNEETTTISFSTTKTTRIKLKDLVWHFSLEAAQPVSQSSIITKAIDALYDQAIIEQSEKA